tara:strand:+ start:25 stop:798 length:774 start_codon:yes stop_codon:yes gene_type:complete
MKNIFKKSLKIISPKSYQFIKDKKNSFLINRLIIDNSKTLVFIHIGKCAGTTTHKVLRNSTIVKYKFSSVYRIHLSKPPILKNASYAIICRNPIQRAISAFNWSYKLALDSKKSELKGELKHEYKVFKKFKTFNNLCENLYINGAPNPIALDHFQKIHHLRKNIAFYLKPLLDKISPSQLFAVFATETLNKDIARTLKIKNSLFENKNHINISNDKKFLSKKSYSNLKILLEEDYKYVSKLLSMSKVSSVTKELLLK